LELAQVLDRQPIEQATRSRRELDQHFAPVIGIGPPPDESRPLASIDQTDRALVAELKAIGEVADGRPALEPPNEQEQLMLGGRDPCVPRRILGESQKPAEGRPPPGEAPIVRVCQLLLHRDSTLPKSDENLKRTDLS
jgi:hypothetical protein